MFGHQDDDHHHHDGDNQPINDAAFQPSVDGILSTENHGGTTVHDDFNPAIPNDNNFGAPATNDQPVNEAAVQEGAPAEQPAVAAPASNDLLAIKQQALTALSPLVGHLDQTPEEKFRTTMMLIQASDDQSMIAVAYEAAQGITEEKVKAQALLDVVNEINYFTQQQAGA